MLVNRIGAGFCRTNTLRPDPMEKNRVFSRLKRRWASPPIAAFHGVDSEGKEQSICTADEVHYVPVSGSNWNLALWRYLPSPKTTSRNRPLLLLSGVATNAIGYDLSPESSFARYMSAQGFDTWTLEVRGAGLSTHTGLLDVGQNYAISRQIRDLNSRLRDFFEEGKHNFPTQVLDMQDRFTTTLEEFQKQIELIVNYDWDFDHYLEEDVPAAIDYIGTQCQPKDGKMHAIGHSMGGILLYAMLSRCSYDGKDSGLASIVALASSLDYTPSKSSLKLFLPLAEPAQALNIPIIPIGSLLATAYPLGPPFLLSWLSSQVTAQGLKDEKLLEKLILKNLCTVPSRLLLQLTTAFHKGGLRDRNGSFFYKDHLHKSNVPVLALAGDQDRVCPPEAVYETVKLIPEDLVTYKVFGEPGGPHYSHFDLVGGRLAADELYPIIIKFLVHND